MKRYTRIFSIGLLLFSGIAYSDNSQSIIPRSMSDLVSNASSAISSWSSSALATVAALSTETKLAIGGGLAILTGDYLLYRYLGKKYRIEDQEETAGMLRDVLNQSGLVRGKDPRLCKMTSVAPRRRYSVIDDQSKILKHRSRSHSVTSIGAHLVQGRPHRPVLPENIGELIAQIPAQKYENDLVERPRSNSDVSSAPSTASFDSLVSTSSRKSSSVASSRGISSDESEPSSTVQRRLSGSLVSSADISRDIGRTRSQSVSDLGGQELDYPWSDRTVFIRNAGMVSANTQGHINLLHAQDSSKKREERQRKQQEIDNEQAIKDGYTPLDTEDCDGLRACYVQEGKRIMALAEQGKELPATLETVLALTVLHYQYSNENSVLIKNPGGTTHISDCFTRYWARENGQEGLGSFSTYMSDKGTLVVELPEGEKRQGCILPNEISYLELSPDGNGVEVTLHENAPSMESNWRTYVQYGLAKLKRVLGGIGRETATVVSDTTEQITRGLKQRATRQERYLRQAAASGNNAMIVWSLANGADINAPARNNDLVGLRPLHCAIMNGQQETARLLLQMGAKPCLASWHDERAGLLPIHIAAEKGDLEMVSLLLESGASCTTKFVRLDSKQEVSALDLAKQYGHVSVVRALAKKLYPTGYRDIYGDCPKLAYINHTWNMFGTDTPEVIDWKITVLTCAYEDLGQDLKGKKKLKGRKIANIDGAELQHIKKWLDSQLILLAQKSSELHTIINKGPVSQEDFIRAMDAECAANKLTLHPEDYYLQIGYETWKKGVQEASFEEVKRRFNERANRNGLSDDEARMYRQIGFFLAKNVSKWTDFNRYLKLRNQGQEEPNPCYQSQEEQDGFEFDMIEANDHVVSEAFDAEGPSRAADLGVDADYFVKRYVQMTNCNALMYLKEMQTAMQRELKRKRPGLPDDGDEQREQEE